MDNGSEGSEPQWVARTFLTRRWRSGFRSLPGEAASLARTEPECEPGVAVPMGLLGKFLITREAWGRAPRAPDGVANEFSNAWRCLHWLQRGNRPAWGRPMNLQLWRAGVGAGPHRVNAIGKGT